MKIDWNDKTNWIAVLFLGIVVFCVLIRIGNYFSLTKSEWASWVQAIGSILAIAGSFLISKNQGKRDDLVQKKRKLSETVELLEVCEAIAYEAYESIKVVSLKYQRHEYGSDFRYSSRRLKNVDASITIMLGKPIPATMFKPLIEMQRLISYTIGSVERRYRKDADISEKAVELLCSRADTASEIHIGIKRSAAKYSQEMSSISK